jgi:hypothetical protein
MPSASRDMAKTQVSTSRLCQGGSKCWVAKDSMNFVMASAAPP